MTVNQSTISVRSGLNSDEQNGCVVSPITLSTTYNFIEFNKPRVYDYSRRRNPTRDLAQKALADLEYGKYSIITSSGMSAIYLVCITFLDKNDFLIAPYDCYGGTYRLLESLHSKGICQVRFIDQSDKKSVLQAFKKYNPKLFFMETPSNPLLRIADISFCCNFLKNKLICVVDNTFMTPVFQNPLKLGADLVIHSCSKYLNGHSDVIAGSVITNNVNFYEKLSWWANTLGITGSAFDSYQLLRGIRTLIPRVYQQQRNAKRVIDFCSNHFLISKLYYPGLLNHSGYDIACKQQSGFGSIFSFELNGINCNIAHFLNSLKLFTLAESFGGVESLISHPETMTHASMSKSAREKAGINNMLFRVSIGLEDSNDLICDLNQALKLIS